MWEELLTILVEKYRGDEPEEAVRRALGRDRELVTAFGRAWPLLDPLDVVADLWSVPAYLRRCAPWLSVEEIRTLRRADLGPGRWRTCRGWTRPTRRRVGDPEASLRRRRDEGAGRAARRDGHGGRRADRVARLRRRRGLMTMLYGEDMRTSLVDSSVLSAADPDLLAGPFAHVVVDEAQELTDAQWQMLLARCPSRSSTVVGDRAQAQHGFTESWPQRLARAGFDRVEGDAVGQLPHPAQVMAAAEPVIRAVLPDANVPTSIRDGARCGTAPARTCARWWTAGSPPTARVSRASSAIRRSRPRSGSGR
ncbi:hypothetical protein V2I01_38450 [Micromonospora sp. BRA006-A]|nr:hypothetical protein [Micromonospora sp. BRA006-A]